jgi:hypothetical protein
MSVRAIVSIASILGLLVTAAIAQQFVQPASTACNAADRGTVNCPTYTAPATTAVPRAPMDGSMNVPATTSTTLFNGAVPPNGFMVHAAATCYVNDNGPASIPASGPPSVLGAGFWFAEPATFITPPGYKPIGAVSVICGSATYVAARGW